MPDIFAMETILARRKELQGICNDIVASIGSDNRARNSGLDRLAAYKSYMRKNSVNELLFDIVEPNTFEEKRSFPEISRFYRGALQRHLIARRMQTNWVKKGLLKLTNVSSVEFACEVFIETDLGRVFSSKISYVEYSHTSSLMAQSE